MFKPMHTPEAQRDAFGLARIGRSPLDLMGIRFADGEGANAPAGGDGGQQTPPPAPPAGSPTPPANGSADGSSGDGSEDDGRVRFEDLDPATQAYVKRLRKEAADERSKRTQAEQERLDAQAQKDKVLAALGLKPDGSEKDPDPAELQSTLEQERQKIAATQQENLVLRVAPLVGANADKMLDSMTFRAKLEALGPQPAREAVEALIRETIAQDATLKSAPAPARASGGTQHTGTTPSGQRKPLAQALEERFGSGIRRTG